MAGSSLAGDVESYAVEKRFIRSDESVVWTRVTISAVRDVAGEIEFFIALAEDISERKAFDEARASEQELAEQLLALVAMFQPQADERGIQLTREDSSGLGMVMCDRSQVERVLSNLIGNAVKFTGERGTVAVRAERSEGAVHVSVSDTGPGVPVDDLAHVFDRFWQADRTRRFGTGLGLVIAKGIVESHGGTIRADSTVGRGSCFRFSLPVG